MRGTGHRSRFMPSWAGGVVEYVGNRFSPIGYGAVLTEKDSPFEQRLAEIYDSVLDICRRYQPEALSIEKLYYQHNQTTVIGVAEARGVILLAAGQCGGTHLRIYPHAGQAGHHRGTARLSKSRFRR